MPFVIGRGFAVDQILKKQNETGPISLTDDVSLKFYSKHYFHNFHNLISYGEIQCNSKTWNIFINKEIIADDSLTLASP